MDHDQFSLRELTTHAEYNQCVELQRATWGDDFRELVPPAILLVVQKVGGILGGAFDARGDLVGFVFGITGYRDGEPIHWSHMLAVRHDLRDRGIGWALKLYQRDRLRERSVGHVQWTFDPLVARNAHLNLVRLGARVLEYVPHMYGDEPTGAMDAVIGSDRLVVEWLLDPEDGAPEPVAVCAAPVVTADVGRDAAAPQPELPNAAEVRVEIPADIQTLKLSSPHAATAWRQTTRRALLHYLERGYTVRGLQREPDTDRRFYIVSREGS